MTPPSNEPPVRCIEPGTTCQERHPGGTMQTDHAQHLLPVIYDSTAVRLSTNAWGRPDHPNPLLREVCMSAFIDPDTDTWRWALEVWSGGGKTTHDYPHPPTAAYADAVARLGL